VSVTLHIYHRLDLLPLHHPIPKLGYCSRISVAGHDRLQAGRAGGISHGPVELTALQSTGSPTRTAPRRPAFARVYAKDLWDLAKILGGRRDVLHRLERFLSLVRPPNVRFVKIIILHCHPCRPIVHHGPALSYFTLDGLVPYCQAGDSARSHHSVTGTLLVSYSICRVSSLLPPVNQLKRSRGTRFSCTPYYSTAPHPPNPVPPLTPTTLPASFTPPSLVKRFIKQGDVPIWQSIQYMDHEGIELLRRPAAFGALEKWEGYLLETKVCSLGKSSRS